ncbi:MAG: flippase-like domain-containing protein [Chitinivibrionales bacterium]|nr:flippase-like domain-containing protein [Chitinivibrionales bacterium]MBD3357324.1 flippase-like domain-containing protein [Chitinivibrionales bacterium]
MSTSKRTQAVRHWRIPRWLRFTAAIVPLVWIFSRIEPRELIEASGRVAWWTVPTVLCIALSVMVLQGVRWWLLMFAFMPELPLKSTLTVHFKALFYSLALPSSAAQDVVRAAVLARQADYSIVWGATWVARLLGLLVLVLLSLMGLTQLDTQVAPAHIHLVISGTIILIAVLLVFSFSKKVTKRLRPAFQRILPYKITRIVEEIRQAIYVYIHKLPTLLGVLVITLAMQLLLILNATLLIMGITGEFLFEIVLSFIPLIEILCLSLPLTPNGIGVREALLALMFNQVGLSEEQLGLYVVIGFLVSALKVVGGVPILWESVTARNTDKNG